MRGVASHRNADDSVRRGTRGQSEVVGVLLVVALTIGLSAAVYVAVADLQSDTADSLRVVTPHTVDAHASAEPEGGQSYETTVEVMHVTGGAVDVRDLEVEVSTPERRARLVDLPVSDCPTTSALDGNHTRGDEIFVAGCQWGGVAVESTSDIWSTGDSLTLRLEDANVPAFDDPESYRGESVELRVVDSSKDSVVTEEEVEIGG